MLPPLIVISGPTGVGKSEAAVDLAEALGEGEIVNYDSVQIYRGFDLGSAKPAPELRALIPHHLFDIAEGNEELNAAEFARRATPLIEQIRGRAAFPILVGGTGFYLRAILRGLPEMVGKDEPIRARLRAIAARGGGPARLHRWLARADPVSAARIAPADRHRVERALEVYVLTGRPISSFTLPAEAASLPVVHFALTLGRARLVEILDERVEAMYARGLIEETRRLAERVPLTARPYSAIGYREAVEVIRGDRSPAEAIEETKRRTRAYAKRQLTWLRSERGVHWVDAIPRGEAVAKMKTIVESEMQKLESS